MTAAVLEFINAHLSVNSIECDCTLILTLFKVLSITRTSLELEMYISGELYLYELDVCNAGKRVQFCIINDCTFRTSILGLLDNVKFRMCTCPTLENDSRN